MTVTHVGFNESVDFREQGDWFTINQIINFHFQSVLFRSRFFSHLFKTVDIDWRDDNRFTATIEHPCKFPLNTSIKNDSFLLLKQHFYSYIDKTINNMDMTNFNIIIARGIIIILVEQVNVSYNYFLTCCWQYRQLVKYKKKDLFMVPWNIQFSLYYIMLQRLE